MCCIDHYKYLSSTVSVGYYKRACKRALSQVFKMSSNHGVLSNLHQVIFNDLFIHADNKINYSLV